MEVEIIDILIEKYLEDTASQEEINQVDAWYNSFDSKPDLFTTHTAEMKQTMEQNFFELKSKLGL